MQEYGKRVGCFFGRRHFSEGISFVIIIDAAASADVVGVTAKSENFI